MHFDQTSLCSNFYFLYFLYFNLLWMIFAVVFKAHFPHQLWLVINELCLLSELVYVPCYPLCCTSIWQSYGLQTWCVLEECSPWRSPCSPKHDRRTVGLSLWKVLDWWECITHSPCRKYSNCMLCVTPKSISPVINTTLNMSRVLKHGHHGALRIWR